MNKIRKPKNGNVVTKKVRVINPNKAQVRRQVEKREAAQKIASDRARERRLAVA